MDLDTDPPTIPNGTGDASLETSTEEQLEAPSRTVSSEPAQPLPSPTLSSSYIQNLIEKHESLLEYLSTSLLADYISPEPDTSDTCGLVRHLIQSIARGYMDKTDAWWKLLLRYKENGGVYADEISVYEAHMEHYSADTRMLVSILEEARDAVGEYAKSEAENGKGGG